MADISQITQELTQFGPAPDSLDPSNFNQRGDATVKHLHTHVDEQNNLTKQTNKVTREINERAADIDGKYDEIVEKHTDFTPKYNEVVTKHGQVVTMHEEVEADAVYIGARKNEIDAIKTHIDQTKTQIDNDLTTAKSMINEGNGGVIDDTKNSDVSTWSSNELQRRLDLKADETTAYKDWNYKTISNTYAAKDNDALFVEATAPFEITLPASGKIRVVDKAGNFATHNIKLVAGSDKFVLNKDFQRVELFFYDGKWQVVSGTILQQKSGFSVGKITKNKSQLFGSKAVDRCFVRDNLMIAYYKSSEIGDSGYAVAAIDLNTMTDVMPALPSVSSGMSLFAAEAGEELFLFGWNSSSKQTKLFKFNRVSKSWQELDSGSLQALINGSLSSYTHMMVIQEATKNQSVYLRAYKTANGYTDHRIIKISQDGQATDMGEAQRNTGWFLVYDDIFFGLKSNSGSYYISGCKNLRNNTNIPELQSKSLGGMYFYMDYKNNKFFIKLNQTQNPNKIIEWQVGGTPTVVTKSASEISQYTQNIYFDRLNFTKQNAQIKKESYNSISLEYDSYENNRPTRKKEVINNFFAYFDKTTPDHINGNKEYFVGKMQILVLEVTFTPTIFQEEI